MTPFDHDTIEVLIGRVIDGEADEQAVRRLTDAGAEHVDVWRLYGERRADLSRVRAALDADLRRATMVDLPPKSPHNERRGITSLWRPVAALTGWAAALAFAMVLAFQPVSSSQSDIVPEIVRIQDIEPHVIGVEKSDEVDPILLRTERLPDGRWRLTWMRRTLEEVMLDHWDQAWVKQDSTRSP